MLKSAHTARFLHTSGAKFPTVYNPIKSAANPKIVLPKGLVYNPPAAAPTPHQTPKAFLPPNDPRTKVPSKESERLQKLNAGSKAPSLSPIYQKKYHLTAEQVSEMQKLRNEGWSRKQLAEKFECSTFFVSLSTQAADSHLEEMNRRLETIKSGWNIYRRNARRDRARRHDIWLRDGN